MKKVILICVLSVVMLFSIFAQYSIRAFAGPLSGFGVSYSYKDYDFCLNVESSYPVCALSLNKILTSFTDINVSDEEAFDFGKNVYRGLDIIGSKKFFEKNNSSLYYGLDIRLGSIQDNPNMLDLNDMSIVYASCDLKYCYRLKSSDRLFASLDLPLGIWIHVIKVPNNDDSVSFDIFGSPYIFYELEKGSKMDNLAVLLAGATVLVSAKIGYIHSF